MSNAGWYSDPGGQPGKYRYWSGTSWSDQLTDNPRQTPAPAEASAAPRSRRSTLGWWIASIAAVVVIALTIWMVVRAAAGESGMPWDAPNGNPSINLCTAGVIDSSASPRPSRPGRVSGGRLSYPELGKPWEPPSTDNRVPFGTLAATQVALDQANFGNSGSSWVSSVLVSDLVSGDGFASPKVASEVVLKCVLGKFYADNVVTSKQLSSKAHTVDGHTGWLIEAQLSFDIPGLRAKGERVLMLVVQVKPDQFGLFYASVPDTSPDRLPEARKVMAALTVD